MNPKGWIAAALVVLALAGCAGGPRLPPPPPQTFDREAVVRGAGLAKLGDCPAKALDGGDQEGWYAPPLNARSPASTP